MARNPIRKIAVAGLGHPGSLVAGALAEFDGRIFVGSAAPGSTLTEDRGRIHAFDPTSKKWRNVFEAPLMPVNDQQRARAAWLGSGLGGGRQRSEMRTDVLAAAQGVVSMAVFQGPSDAAPCLYASTMSVRGARILRSENGKRFDPVAAPGLGDDRIFAFRDLTVWRGSLWAVPVGMTTEEALDRVYPPDPLIAVSDDPAQGAWDIAIDPGFGEADNIAITSLAVAWDALYAATANPARGFQLWRLAEPDGEWEKVLTDGAGRFSPNLMVTSMTAFAGALFLGTGIPGLGYDPETDTGPAACEVIRLQQDGSWDLIMGQPRFYDTGLKQPLSGMGPGFSNKFNAAIWSMSIYKNRLYAGTHNWEPLDGAAKADSTGVEGGAELWMTIDGQSWERIQPGILGGRTQTGFRALLATGQGLVVGSYDQTRTIRQQLMLNDKAELLDEVAEGFEVSVLR